MRVSRAYLVHLNCPRVLCVDVWFDIRIAKYTCFAIIPVPTKRWYCVN